MSNTPAELWGKEEAREGEAATSTLASPHQLLPWLLPVSLGYNTSRPHWAWSPVTQTPSPVLSLPGLCPSFPSCVPGVQHPNRDHMNPNKRARQPQPCPVGLPGL